MTYCQTAPSFDLWMRSQLSAENWFEIRMTVRPSADDLEGLIEFVRIAQRRIAASEASRAKPAPRRP